MGKKNLLLNKVILTSIRDNTKSKKEIHKMLKRKEELKRTKKIKN